MKCPKCGHDGNWHNDAGSEPTDMAHDHGWIPSAVMCCYHKPNDGETGILNWGSKVCGCDYPAQGSERYY